METVHARARELSPMIGLIKGHQLFEGRSSAIQREDGKLDETPIHRASGEVTIKREMLVDFNETTVARHLEEIAEQLVRDMSEQFQQRMNEVTAETGNGGANALTINPDHSPGGRSSGTDRIMKARTNDFAVAAAGPPSLDRFAIHQHHITPGKRQLTRDGDTDDSGPHNDRVDLFQHRLIKT
jgi:hypothetical protein